MTWLTMLSSAVLATWKSDMLGPHLTYLVHYKICDLSSTKPSHTSLLYLHTLLISIYIYIRLILKSWSMSGSPSLARTRTRSRTTCKRKNKDRPRRNGANRMRMRWENARPFIGSLDLNDLPPSVCFRLQLCCFPAATSSSSSPPASPPLNTYE